MSLSLEHNGFNLERRKMYPSNPRNNLISQVDLVWERSLMDPNVLSTSALKLKKLQQTQNIADIYNRKIQAKIEEELKINKSTFRVMPAHQSLRKSQNIRDSLNEEVENYKTARNYQEKTDRQLNESRYERIPVDYSKRIPIQNSSLLSSSVFGYQLNYETFKRESYFSKMLSQRLEPFLNKNSPENKKAKHRTIAINSPAPIYY